ncbi:hypothetical protein FHS27_001760 [Rhodopirellula rubra]|uniref:Uncharacterized protein n=1 Tax=Aporhodopirellula rubra TaxID=980271 RepID=A0A7W5DYH8_9BACT|nr:hypothetical protein [Aporhodopirellula rubra]
MMAIIIIEKPLHTSTLSGLVDPVLHAGFVRKTIHSFGLDDRTPDLEQFFR